jgi:uncharacterized protein GlcG (DUF336 family)
MGQNATSMPQTVRSLAPKCGHLLRLRLHHWALFLTVAGWSLMWAKALALTPLIPSSGAVLTFLLGVGLIPLSSITATPATGASSEASEPPAPADARKLEKETYAMHGSSLAALLAVVVLIGAGSPQRASAATCPATHDQLTQALRASVKPSGGPGNGGLDNNEWAALVARDGTICAVTFSGSKPDDQWPGSRAIAAEKANTANAFSLKTFALSTANLYASAQPGGTLFGAQASNPVAPDVLYGGDAAQFGGGSDPMLGKHLGGVIVFGGGLALYGNNEIVGGLGLSGDTSCADHNIAWRVRQALGLDHVPAGVTPNNNDGIVYDMLPDKTSASGYGHITCKGFEAQIAEQIHAGIVPQWAKPTQ